MTTSEPSALLYVRGGQLSFIAYRFKPTVSFVNFPLENLSGLTHVSVLGWADTSPNEVLHIEEIG